LGGLDPTKDRADLYVGSNGELTLSTWGGTRGTAQYIEFKTKGGTNWGVIIRDSSGGTNNFSQLYMNGGVSPAYLNICTAVGGATLGLIIEQNQRVGINKIPANYVFEVAGDVSLDSGKVYRVNAIQVVGARVIDARIDDDINSGGYGEMYANNIGQVVTILSKDVYVQVPAGLSEGLNSGFTFQNARELKCLVAGVYQIHWSMSMQATAQSTEIEGAVLLNWSAPNGAQAKGTAHAEVSIGGVNRPETISGTLILALAVNDLISLGVSNHTDAADVNLQHASLTLRRIHD
jgi:hypothetical protein